MLPSVTGSGAGCRRNERARVPVQRSWIEVAQIHDPRAAVKLGVIGLLAEHLGFPLFERCRTERNREGEQQGDHGGIFPGFQFCIPSPVKARPDKRTGSAERSMPKKLSCRGNIFISTLPS